ncbi:MAG: lamin tail domain-containing protein [Paludibacteraceae bacterium]|nr:lamin tail domain-containing protein [Paludibacteraceae bacterium]
MKKSWLIFIYFLPVFCFGQVHDDFSDGNFTENPSWTGMTENFIINENFQLQSNAPLTSVSYLFTPSEVFYDAEWKAWLRINYSTSSSNYSAFYIISSSPDNVGDAYFVKVGDTQDDVSLWKKQGNSKIKIIDGTDKRTDGTQVELQVKVTRDSLGNFSLFSKLPGESDFVLEGTVRDTTIESSSFVGFLYSNTTTTTSAYFFDDMSASGKKAEDKKPPVWEKLTTIEPDTLQLQFSEPVDLSNAIFLLNGEEISPEKISIFSTKPYAVKLTLNENFDKGKIYTFELLQVTDLAGNALIDNIKQTGIIESLAPGDLLLNEVMFNAPPMATEYIEIYNASAKTLDVSGIALTTRKSDGSLNTLRHIPDGKLLAAGSFLAVCQDADSVINYFGLQNDGSVVSISWSSLNNQQGTIVLANSKADTVYDELTYNEKWHHIMIKNPQGVSLERINPDLPTQSAESWHSAASEVKYGTPGYKNSQYREIESISSSRQFVWAEPEAFSPDNDGTDDVCFIKYRTPTEGFVANAQIMNATGTKVFQLVANALLSTEGFFSWDGRTDNGKIANAGIYVLYFEMIQPETGEKKQLKIPIVVSAR